MPKETLHVPKLKEGRFAKKESSARYPAGIISLAVLGNGAVGAPRSLYVFTDQTRYLFNCGEGTQRLAHEHKMKLAKLEHIFITRNSWDNTGGLPGVALTIQDIGVPEITLHGPGKVEDIFEGTRRFVVLKELKIKVANVADPEGYGDATMHVQYVHLSPSQLSSTGNEDPTAEKSNSSSEESIIEEDETDYYARIKGCKRNLEITSLSDPKSDISKKAKISGDGDLAKGSPSVSESRSEVSTPIDVVLCYVCRPRKKDGMLMIEKCVEFGVPSGPLLGKLKCGHDVKLPDGKVVKAADVRSPDSPGPVFLVVDCPDERYLDSLVNNPTLNHFHDPSNPEDFLHVVVHFTPSKIMLHPKYQEWLGKFRVTTRHILINDACLGQGSEAVHRIQHKLSLLDKDIFPLLKEDGVELYHPFTPTSTLEEFEECTRNKIDLSKPPEKLKDLKVPVWMGSTLMKYNLRPTQGLDTTSNLIINPEEYVRQVLENSEFPGMLESLQEKFNSLEKSTEIYPEFTFLGTGSCIPNKTRNVSAILVQTDPESLLLMDCGEGTYGQLVRLFGSDQIDQLLAKLKSVYVSHLHADHHLGVVQIIRQRVLSLRRLGLPLTPLYLVAPLQIQTWLHMYNKLFEKIRGSYLLVPNQDLRFNLDRAQNNLYADEVKQLLGLKEIKTTLVRHCPNAFGVALTHNSGWKITYSGDTMPCDDLVELGKDSDVLIHEATMEDDLKKEAVLKMHSTTSEAIQQGNKMNAKFILLTHFSQRYAKVPQIDDLTMDEEGKGPRGNVGIAFDYMRVRKCDLPKLPLMYDALKILFNEEIEDIELKTRRRQKKKELLQQSQMKTNTQTMNVVGGRVG